MHMESALVTTAVAGTMYACSAGTGVFSIKEAALDFDKKKLPFLGVMGGFVFAAQMLNFTIPGTGSSGHLCGGMLLTALFGPYAAFLTMAAILLVQCLLFADGGLLALGCNIWNMAFYGCFVGYFCFYRPAVRNGLSRGKLMAVSVIGSVVTLQMGAFSVVLETLVSGITSLPFAAFAASMQPIHLAIGLVEGLITGAALLFIYEMRPGYLEGEEKCEIQGTETQRAWIQRPEMKKGMKNRMGEKSLLLTMALLTLIFAGGLSYAASSKPDGLEWSVEKAAGTVQAAGTGQIQPEAAGTAHKLTDQLQQITALLPDYSWKTGDLPFGTAAAGITGSLMVAVLCAGGGALLQKASKSTKKIGRHQER